MLIECLLKRVGGTTVELGTAAYHFAPQSDAPTAPHVAEVEDQAHVDTLLAIPEAYQPATGPRKAKKPKGAIELNEPQIPVVELDSVETAPVDPMIAAAGGATPPVTGDTPLTTEQSTDPAEG